MNQNDKLILCVGICVLDIIHVCQEYPEEDSDRRALNGRWQRGGNASNMCTVLRQFGAECEFIGSLSDSKAFSFLIEDCRDRGIVIDHCVYHTTPIAPFSSVILNEINGSRTIIHSNPNMPILSADDFSKIPYERYKWIHFEARNVHETKRMIDSIVQWNAEHPDQRITISVELENRTEKNLPLVADADYVYLSKDFAEIMGWMSKEVAIHNLRKYVKKEAKLVVPWGIEGAIAVDNESDTHFSAMARPPAKVVDTLGAGDTFVASTLYALSNGIPLQDSIDFGCRIAGKKVGFYGYDNIALISDDLLTKIRDQ
ncbi:ketohexokinase-like [Contarinia nasturtii]|uniref:ketohexokinase-like n=1 Tax=Contarinia nasturtii TaxID=265458 RepID=UPI0012D46AFA|nr:ketohexokinase-like [Contarinia nasturtii]